MVSFKMAKRGTGERNPAVKEYIKRITQRIFHQLFFIVAFLSRGEVTAVFRIYQLFGRRKGGKNKRIKEAGLQLFSTDIMSSKNNSIDPKII
jgi:hypothetical protein